MRPLHMFFGLLVAAIWGANFVAARYALAFFPPFYLTALRFVLVSALLVPFVRRSTSTQIRHIVPVSLMSTFSFSLIFVALYHGLDIPSGALVSQLGVPFSCLLGAIFLKDRLGWFRLSGIAIAFIGIAIVAGTPNVIEHIPGFLFALGSALTWAIANVLIKRLQNMDSMMMLAWVALCAAPMLFVLSVLFESSLWPPLMDVTPTAAEGFLFTTFASTIIAYGLWFFLLARYTVSQVTPFSLLVPVFGIAFSRWFFDNALTQETLIGGAITILGVAIIVLRRPRILLMGDAT